MAVAGTDTVRTCITATNDDDMLVLGADLTGHPVAGIHHVLLTQKIHGEMDATQLASRYGQVACSLSPAGQNDGVELLAERFRTTHCHALRGVLSLPDIG